MVYVLTGRKKTTVGATQKTERCVCSNQHSRAVDSTGVVVATLVHGVVGHLHDGTACAS